MDYPVRLIPDDNGTWRVECRDIPEVHTFGEDKAEALRRAEDAIATALEFYIRDKRPIPWPSTTGRVRVVLSPMVAIKLQVYEAMRAHRVTRSELARRLHCHRQQIDRLLDLRHGSRLEQLDAAARALGAHISARLEMDKKAS